MLETCSRSRCCGTSKKGKLATKEKNCFARLLPGSASFLIRSKVCSVLGSSFFHKISQVLIAGNHDGAMEAMGAEKIRAILAEHGGNVVYLEHQTASAGNLKVFGSPFGHW